MSERLVICGGLPTPGRGAKALELDVNAPENSASRVKPKLGDISTRMVENVPEVLTDLLEIATYVYCADQCTRRGGSTLKDMGKDWRRRFRFLIPVRRLGIWSRPEVQEMLVETLSFLSDDDYAFEFADHPAPGGLQPYLEFPESSDRGFVPDEVVLFSGGLDSFAGAVESLIGADRKVALVSHRASTWVTKRQNHLIGALRDRTKRSQLFHVPLTITKGGKEGKDFHQRCRSFLFATIGLVVARLFHRNTVRFYENGIVSVNLPVASHVLGTRATRTTHPKVLHDFSNLFSLILDQSVTVENPYFWRTKSDVVSVIAEHGCADLIQETFSCTRVREATKRQQHCGICSQCIDRQFGILGAGLGQHEPADAYAVDLFRGERSPGPDVVMAESYVLHALRLATMSDRTFFSSFGQIFKVLPYLDGSAEENARRLHVLHQAHGHTVLNVVDQALASHATLTGSLTLPKTSLLMLIQSASVRLPPVIDPADSEPPASQQAAADLRRTIERPLMFAIDDQHQKVLFRGGIEISGAGYQLIKALKVEFTEDMAAECPRDQFQYVKADVLASRLGLDGQGMRQRITRFRKSLEEKFLKVYDFKPAEDEVIQNQEWQGYRLNPYLIQLSPGQLAKMTPEAELQPT